MSVRWRLILVINSSRDLAISEPYLARIKFQENKSASVIVSCFKSSFRCFKALLYFERAREYFSSSWLRRSSK